MSDEFDNWDWSEPETVEAECDHCGESLLCQRRADPMLEEVNEEIVESYWCRPCWSERKEEV